jgi:outer membrane protein TolC
MNRKTILCFFLFISIIQSNIYAQRILTLEEVRELAIQNNKRLKMATEEERVAYYEKKEAFLKYFPKLSATGTYLRNQKDIYLLGSSILPPSVTIPLPMLGNVEIPIPDEANEALREVGHLKTQNIWVGGVSLTQPLFMGGRIVAYNDIMENAKQLAAAKKDMELQEVIAELDAAYWQVVSLTEKKKLANSYLELLQKMTSDVSVMEQEGVATKADVLSVRVKQNEADVTLTKVDNGLSLSKMLLNQLCGLPIEEQITLADENGQLQITPEESQALPSVDEALQNRPEIRSLELATKIYKGKEKVVRADFLPEIGLMANYLWTNPNSFDGFQNKFGGMWNIGVLVNVPLNILSSSTKLNAAKAQTHIQEYQLAEASEKIELQVNQNAFKLNEAYKKYDATKRNLESANENLRYANAGFEEGVIPASDVLAAYTAWLSANSEVIDAQIDVKLSRLYLNKALGRSLK